MYKEHLNAKCEVYYIKKLFCAKLYDTDEVGDDKFADFLQYGSTILLNCEQAEDDNSDINQNKQCKFVDSWRIGRMCMA